MEALVDEDMIVLSSKYATGYISPVMAQACLEQECVLTAESELEKVKALLRGSGAEKHIHILEARLDELKAAEYRQIRYTFCADRDCHRWEISSADSFSDCAVRQTPS